MTCLCMPAARFEQRQHERPADAAAAAIRAHVDAVLDAVPIAGPCAKLAERAESEDARMHRCATRTGKPARGFGVEPGFAIRQA